MTDHAPSLLRTIFRPALSRLLQRVTGHVARLPVAANHAVPAIRVRGLILDRHVPGDQQLAAAMYAGHYCFAGETFDALPDTAFTLRGPSPRWRAGLMRMDWLRNFRSSGRAIHRLYALRLISAWMVAKPRALGLTDSCAALFNLAVDAPAIAHAQSPAAVTITQAAILLARRRVEKLRPESGEQKLDLSLTLLAAQLAAGPMDKYVSERVEEIGTQLDTILTHEGMAASGDLAALLELRSKLMILVAGLVQADGGSSASLRLRLDDIERFLSMLVRPDGTLAFSNLPAAPALITHPSVAPNRLMESAGYARLAGQHMLLVAALGQAQDQAPLRAEIFVDGTPFLWFEELSPGRPWRRHAAPQLRAYGGILLEVNTQTGLDERRCQSLFLSADGTDLRFEDDAAGLDLSCYALTVAPTSKISTTHGGAGAVIAVDKKAAWEIRVRGGRIEADIDRLRIVPDPAGESATLNFALRRMERPIRSKPVRPEKSKRLL